MDKKYEIKFLATYICATVMSVEETEKEITKVFERIFQLPSYSELKNLVGYIEKQQKSDGTDRCVKIIKLEKFIKNIIKI